MWDVEADSAELKTAVSTKITEAREAQLSLLAQELKVLRLLFVVLHSTVAY